MPFQLGMENSMEEYKQWRASEVDKAVLADYQKARQRLKKREAHENGLLNSEGAEQLEKFREYLALEKDEGEPARVQCLYERAVAEHCLVAQVWEEYIAYLESTIKIETVITPVYTRAIRNCPWAVELWCGQLRAYEKYEKESHEVTKVFEQVQHLFPQPYFLQNKHNTSCRHHFKMEAYCNRIECCPPGSGGRLLRALLLSRALAHFHRLQEESHTL